MAIINEAHAKWQYPDTTSTGALKAVNFRGRPARMTAYVTASAGCTGTVRVETCAGSSAGPYATLGSTDVSTNLCRVMQFAGPVEWVRPYCTAKTTGTITVEVFGN